ncbi:MAG: glucosyltransferase domain-containing protein [Phycisphaerales bacterium]|nr:glucosyltransferase domain-containing protein [Phycisphaerales bacterium]
MDDRQRQTKTDDQGNPIARGWYRANRSLQRCESWGIQLGISSWTKGRSTLAFAFIVCLASYGIDLFNTGFSTDEVVWSSTHGATLDWIGQGRWGMYLFNVLLPNPTLPYISQLIGYLSLALSATLAVSLWGGLGQFRGYIGAALIVSTPLLAFILHFNTAQYGVMPGMLLAVLSIRFFVSGKLIGIVTGGLMLVFAISVYQAVAMIAIVVYLGWLLNNKVLEPKEPVNEKQILKSLFLFAGWFGIVLALHKVSAMVAWNLWAPNGEYKVILNVYNDSIIPIEQFRLTAGLNRFRSVLSGGTWYLGRITSGLVVVCSVIILARLGGLKKPWGTRALGALVLSMLLATPFLLDSATGRPWPSRTLLAVPFLLGALATTALGVRASVHRWVITAACAACIWHFIVSNNRLMYADKLTWESDRALAIDLQLRLRSAGLPKNEPTRLVIIGFKKFTPTPLMFREETIGRSIFTTEQIWPNRVSKLLSLTGTPGITGTDSASDFAHAIMLSESMPSWPIPGSVLIDGDLAVIKFGEPTNKQRRLAEEK